MYEAAFNEYTEYSKMLPNSKVGFRKVLFYQNHKDNLTYYSQFINEVYYKAYNKSRQDSVLKLSIED